MRHLVAHRKLGRTTEHRIALLRNLATSLINSKHGRIVTTLAKAKELRPFVEKAITLGKRGNLHSRRLAASYFIGGHAKYRYRLHKKLAVTTIPATAGVAALDKLFDEIAPRYADRNGGYTRIIKLGPRKGDGAEMAIIELVGNEQAIFEQESKKKTGEKKEKQERREREGFGRGFRRFFRRREKQAEAEPAASRGADAESTSETAPGQGGER